MGSILDVDELDPPPDGAYWPGRFLVDKNWFDTRDPVWRAVTGNPGMQAKRDADALNLRNAGQPV